MNLIIQVVHMTTVTIAKAIFNPMFLTVNLIVCLMQKKLNNINIYGYKQKNQTLIQLIDSIIVGIIAGIVIGSIITYIGLPIRMTNSMVLLLPISIILSLINPKYICMSYSASILSILSLVFRGQRILNIALPVVDVDISGLMTLVAILHFIEGVLVYLFGAKYSFPVVTKKDSKIVVGHMMQGMWPIPFSLLVVIFGTNTSSTLSMPQWWPLLDKLFYANTVYALLPLIGVMGFRTITYTYRPIEKAKNTSIQLFVYSILLAIISMLVDAHSNFIILGILYMFLAHEGIIKYGEYIENKRKYIYALPPKGIRIMCVKPNGIADGLGLEAGDTILRINGGEVVNIEDYRDMMRFGFNYVWLEVEGINGLKRTVEYKDYQHPIDKLDFQPIPEKPRVIIRFDTINRFNLIRIIYKKLRRKI